MSYAGESNAKKLARALAYECIAEELRHLRRKATVVALAGPEGRDVELAAAFGLTNDPASVLLVDIEEAGLAVAKERYPGVKTFLGPMSDVAPPWHVDVAVLDWCGHADSKPAIAAYRNLRPYLRPGSVLAVTFLRGREGPTSNVTTVNHILRKVKQFSNMQLRHFAVGDSVARALGMSVVLELGDLRGLRDSQLVLREFGLVNYKGHASPMGISLLQVTRALDFKRVWKTPDQPGKFLLAELTADATKPAALVEKADYLERKGINPAQALSISPGTLAAWRAHRTMGTYAEAS